MITTERKRRPTLYLGGIRKPQETPKTTPLAVKSERAAGLSSRGRPLTDAPLTQDTRAEASLEQTKAAKKEARHAAVGLLMDAYPAIFNYVKPRPLAVGIHRQLADAGLLTHNQRTMVLKWWVSRVGYLEALGRDGSERYNLDGTVQGPAADDDRAGALKWARDKQGRARQGKAGELSNQGSRARVEPPQQA